MCGVQVCLDNWMTKYLSHWRTLVTDSLWVCWLWWLTDWLTDGYWHTDWLAEFLNDWLMNELTIGWLSDWLTSVFDWLTEWPSCLLLTWRINSFLVLYMLSKIYGVFHRMLSRNFIQGCPMHKLFLTCFSLVSVVHEFVYGWPSGLLMAFAVEIAMQALCHSPWSFVIFSVPKLATRFGEPPLIPASLAVS